MNSTIACIPADNQGGKLWIKDYREDGSRMYLKYKSTYNDIPWREVEIYFADASTNFVITGEDGTVLFRFSVNWVGKIL